MNKNIIAFPYAKPVYAGIVAGLTALSVALQDGVVTGVEAITIALAVLAAVGSVFGVTGTELVNKPATAQEIARAQAKPGKASKKR